MSIYFVMAFLLLASMVMHSARIVKDPIWHTCIIALILLSGFRSGVGVDYYSYVTQISKIIDYDANQFEPLFVFIVKASHFLVGDLEATVLLVLLISASITIFLFGSYINTHSPNRSLSLVLFFSLPVLYFSTFNAIRTFIAIAIFLYSVRYVEIGSYKKYLMANVFALGFHKTALVLMPLYWFLRMNFSISHYALMLISIMFIPVDISVLVFVSEYVGLSGSYFDEGAEGINAMINVKIIFLLFLFFSIAFVTKKYRLKKYYLHLNLLFLGCVVSILQFKFPEIDGNLFNRFTGYFTPSLLILLPAIIYTQKRNRLLAIFIALCLGFGYGFFVLLVKGKHYQLVPYNSVFFN